MNIKVAFIIIFNHRYDGNIEKLISIYKGRFKNIYYLVPFYDGPRSDVISVYENSYYYQGYIAQGFASYFKEEYSHYLFIGDDMILNPVITENNFMEHLHLQENSCFIPELLSHHNIEGSMNTRYAYEFNIKRWGVEAVNELPSYGEALSALRKFNLEFKPLRHEQIFPKANIYQKIKGMVKTLSGHKEAPRKLYDLPYPVVNAFSDMVVITKDVIRKFSHYCGVFAALDLFVEIAVPTSLVLTADKISTEKDLLLQGKFLHTHQELKELDKYNFSLAHLIRKFPESYLYLHPVKLSKWKNDMS